ncbi:aminotransferase class V-fold PLP-dependent enzyme [Microbacterium sp. 179-B 1A2 NHS]|uniref:aminotransferase class V-fold PLP-dependent enzyme n=1 Tax=Microbacterium sp. 179-B 1A2 NHS TaxID=3142383 RepID=UPI0039A1BCC0
MSHLEPYLESFDADPGYLNWASFGPLSPAVRSDAQADAELLGAGRTSGIDLVWGRLGEARALVAEMLGASADDVTLQPSTTQGLMHALFGLSGAVLLSPHEFPSIPVAARRAADALGRLEVRELAAAVDTVTADAVREALTDDVTAVAVSLVDYRTGYLADLPAIREAIGDRLLIVDAVQAVGVVDVDWAAADVVCGNGYKWLRAGRGTGFAWFSPRARERIEPVLSGYAGMVGELGDLEVGPPRPGADAYAISPVDPVNAGRLAVALREVRDAGAAQVAARVADQAARVMAAADAAGIPVLTDRTRHAGIVALAPEARHTGAIAAALINNGLTVTVRGDLIRIAAHAGTPTDTVRRLSDAFAEAAAITPPPAVVDLAPLDAMAMPIDLDPPARAES